MSKLKTQKSVAKRFKISKSGKVQKKTCGQDHFNARETGKTTRKKRKLHSLSDAFSKNVKSFIPYNT